MKKFEEPKMKVITFGASDIVTTSGEVTPETPKTVTLGFSDLRDYIPQQ